MFVNFNVDMFVTFFSVKRLMFVEVNVKCNVES